jgi:hypothetical protein
VEELLGLAGTNFTRAVDAGGDELADFDDIPLRPAARLSGVRWQ